MKVNSWLFTYRTWKLLDPYTNVKKEENKFLDVVKIKIANLTI